MVPWKLERKSPILSREVFVTCLFGMMLHLMKGHPSVEREVQSIWEAELPNQLSLYSVDLIKTTLSLIAAGRNLTDYFYSGSYILVLWSAFTGSRSYFMFPWLMIGALRTVLGFLSSSIGVYFCATYGKLRHGCLEYSAIKAIDLTIALYTYLRVEELYNKMSNRENGIQPRREKIPSPDVELEKQICRRRTRSMFYDNMIRKTVKTNGLNCDEIPSVMKQIQDKGYDYIKELFEPDEVLVIKALHLKNEDIKESGCLRRRLISVKSSSENVLDDTESEMSFERHRSNSNEHKLGVVRSSQYIDPRTYNLPIVTSNRKESDVVCRIGLTEQFGVRKKPLTPYSLFYLQSMLNAHKQNHRRKKSERVLLKDLYRPTEEERQRNSRTTSNDTLPRPSTSSEMSVMNKEQEKNTEMKEEEIPDNIVHSTSDVLKEKNLKRCRDASTQTKSTDNVLSEKEISNIEIPTPKRRRSMKKKKKVCVKVNRKKRSYVTKNNFKRQTEVNSTTSRDDVEVESNCSTSTWNETYNSSFWKSEVLKKASQTTVLQQENSTSSVPLPEFDFMKLRGQILELIARRRAIVDGSATSLPTNVFTRHVLPPQVPVHRPPVFCPHDLTLLYLHHLISHPIPQTPELTPEEKEIKELERMQAEMERELSQKGLGSITEETDSSAEWDRIESEAYPTEKLTVYPPVQSMVKLNCFKPMVFVGNQKTGWVCRGKSPSPETEAKIDETSSVSSNTAGSSKSDYDEGPSTYKHCKTTEKLPKPKPVVVERVVMTYEDKGPVPITYSKTSSRKLRKKVEETPKESIPSQVEYSSEDLMWKSKSYSPQFPTETELKEMSVKKKKSEKKETKTKRQAPKKPKTTKPDKPENFPPVISAPVSEKESGVSSEEIPSQDARPPLRNAQNAQKKPIRICSACIRKRFGPQFKIIPPKEKEIGYNARTRAIAEAKNMKQQLAENPSSVEILLAKLKCRRELARMQDPRIAKYENLEKERKLLTERKLEREKELTSKRRKREELESKDIFEIFLERYTESVAARCNEIKERIEERRKARNSFSRQEKPSTSLNSTEEEKPVHLLHSNISKKSD